ncbi:MAG TPA: F0F1 ATP synthase subunit B [Papillibacter sp.]|nr:F0F1 ATP synthase subunit B [Papillibacter sp.]
MEGLHPSDILINIVNIVILFVLLRAILFKPVSKFLRERREKIEKDLADARQNKAEAEALSEQYEKRLKEAEEEARALSRARQQEADRQAEEIISDARRQADAMVEDARARIAAEKERAVAGAQAEIALMATEIAAKILQREIRAADNDTIVDAFFNETR